MMRVLLAAVIGGAVVVCSGALSMVMQTRRNLRQALASLSASTAMDEAAIRAPRLWAALDSFDEGVIITDCTGREMLRNAAAQQYVTPGVADALVADAVERCLGAAVAGTGTEEELLLHGPPKRSVAVRSVPLIQEGERLGAIVWIRDISEARRTDEVRRDFVANVSHELKTPIGALTVLAETMALADDPVVRQQLADRVVREADRLARIVEDLLDLSLVEAAGSPERASILASSIVADAIDQVRPAADASGIPIITTMLAGDAKLSCDRRQVTSAVTNLLDNAVKYSDPGGIVEVSVVASATAVEIAVCDHGVGIPARDLERVFERFYRVDQARSRETGGTGLGLAIVRHVTQGHGGDVTVSSVEGEGSCFSMRLPRVNGSDLETERLCEIRKSEEIDV